MGLWKVYPYNNTPLYRHSLQVKCSDGTVLKGEGISAGKWMSWVNCPKGKGVCSIRTKVEDPVGGGNANDDTALNNAKICCCKIIPTEYIEKIIYEPFK